MLLWIPGFFPEHDFFPGVGSVYGSKGCTSDIYGFDVTSLERVAHVIVTYFLGVTVTVTLFSVVVMVYSLHGCKLLLF